MRDLTTFLYATESEMREGFNYSNLSHLQIIMLQVYASMIGWSLSMGSLCEGFS